MQTRAFGLHKVLVVYTAYAFFVEVQMFGPEAQVIVLSDEGLNREKKSSCVHG
jgi:hypothetical protein